MAMHENDVLHVDGDSLLPRGALVLHRAAVHQPVRGPLEADRMVLGLRPSSAGAGVAAVDDDGTGRGHWQAAAAVAVRVTGAVL